MEAAALSAGLGFLSGFLNNYLFYRLAKKKDNDDLVDLKDTVEDACSLLHNLNLWDDGNEKMRRLGEKVAMLTDHCYDSEDVLDRFLIEECGSERSVEKWESFVKKATKKTKCIFKRNEIPELVRKVKEIKSQLVTLKSDLENGRCNGNLQSAQHGLRSSFISPTSFYGRNNDVEQICSKLISPNNHEGVSIVGMHGVGKTALAETVLCDPRISNHFPVRLSLGLSNEEFNPETVIINELKNHFQEDKKMEQGSQKLLLLIDNLQSFTQDRHTFWESIKQITKADVKLLITTLNPSVPNLTGTTAHELKPLNDEDCQSVIVASALRQDNNLSENNLKSDAEQLVKKCQGLPQLAQIIGSAVPKWNRDSVRFQKLKTMRLLNLDEFKTDFLPKVGLSYHRMDPASKKCFAYFSLFPHNYPFNLQILSQLWSAEGFIPPSNDPSTSEQAIIKCERSLQSISFLQCCEKITYQVPCVIHQVAELAASSTCLLLDTDTDKPGLSDSVATARHLSLLRVEDNSPIWSNQKLRKKKLRTILSLCKQDEPIGQAVKIPHTPDEPNKFLLKATNVRVLALNGTNVDALPETIHKLIHLRHIDVSNTCIRKLPEKLCHLLSLQFLNFKKTKIKEFPKNFSKLINIMFLYWDENVIYPPPNIGKLEKLQILPMFCLENDTGVTIEALENLNCLESSICITNLEKVKSVEEAQKAKLHDKVFLTELQLQWNHKYKNCIDLEVLEALKPHHDLEKLKITGYGATELPGWISDQSFKLKNLHLFKCNCTQLSAIGQLSALKSLVIEGMGNLIKLDQNFCGQRQDTHEAKSFPSLEFLTLDEMAQFEEWIDLEKEDMPRLKELRFINCPKMISFPSMENHTSLQLLEIKDCGVLKTLPNLPNSLHRLEIESCSDELVNNYGVGGANYKEIERVRSVIIDYKDIPTESNLM